MPIEEVAVEKKAPAKVLSLRDRLKSMPRGRPVPVDMSAFPDWPQGELHMRPLTAREYTEWEKDGLAFDRSGEIRNNNSGRRKAYLVRSALCLENGEPVFGREDEKAIELMDAAVVDHWVRIATALNSPGSEKKDDKAEDDEGN